MPNTNYSILGQEWRQPVAGYIFACFYTCRLIGYYVDIDIYIFIFIFLYLYIYITIYLYMYYICYIYMCVCIYIYIYIYIHIHTHTNTNLPVNAKVRLSYTRIGILGQEWRQPAPRYLYIHLAIYQKQPINCIPEIRD